MENGLNDSELLAYVENMENYIQASLWCSDELTDEILVEAVETIEQEHHMLLQLTYQEVNDYFNVL